MTSNPYGDKPTTKSESGQWHELSFQISIDEDVDWDKVDLRTWVHSVAKYTALMMAKSTKGEDSEGTIKTLVMGVKADKITFVSDDELHNLIDEFDGDDE